MMEGSERGWDKDNLFLRYISHGEEEVRSRLLNIYVQEILEEKRKTLSYRWKERVFRILGWGILPWTLREAENNLQKKKDDIHWAKRKVHNVVFSAVAANIADQYWDEKRNI